MFLSYLWGMETRYEGLEDRPSILVLILPMRNGNLYSSTLTGILNKCSYPTYEEWKLFFIIFLNFILFVLILPMRNGNIHSRSALSICTRFLSYLWGMKHLILRLIQKFQSSSYPWEWNQSTLKLGYYWVFLSYLWEWKHATKFAFGVCMGSYPTDEEWKQNNVLSLNAI